MSVSVNKANDFKGVQCVELSSSKYTAIVSPLTGCSVLRLFDKLNKIEIFRYTDECTMDTINDAREIWGLPTLYLPNRFDKGVIKTSDSTYQLPINEPLFDNFLHGWVHKRVHNVDEAFVDGDKAVLKTSFTHGINDEFYKHFPIDFKIEYTFTLSDEKGLEQEIKLTNLNDKMLPVSLCTHTCLNAPMCVGGNEETMRMSVPIVEKCEIDNRFLSTEKFSPLSDWDMEYKNGTKQPTLQVICNDMYTACMNKLNGEDFYGVVVTDTANGRMICNEVSKEFKFWNMWNHDGDKGYFCPEPMTALINAPNLSLPRDISGYAELAKGEEYSCWQRFFTL